MPAEDDIALDEKRVYGDTRDRTVAYVASALGVTRVDLAGDQVGRFSMAQNCTATGIAAADGRLVVGTDEAVLVGTGEGFETTGFGPARAVGLAAGTPVAAAPDGTVAQLVGDDWETLGSVTHPRRLDGDLLAAKGGVFRVAPGLPDLAVDADVRDVAAAGPYVATADGLLERRDGEWERVAGGDCALVAAEEDEPARTDTLADTTGRAHAVSDDGLLERRDGDWRVHSLPVDAAIADITHGESLYGVTADGTMLVYASPDLTPDGQGGWRTRALGLRGVVGVAVP